VVEKNSRETLLNSEHVAARSEKNPAETVQMRKDKSSTPGQARLSSPYKSNIQNGRD